MFVWVRVGVGDVGGEGRVFVWVRVGGWGVWEVRGECLCG